MQQTTPVTDESMNLHRDADDQFVTCPVRVSFILLHDTSMVCKNYLLNI